MTISCICVVQFSNLCQIHHPGQNYLLLCDRPGLPRKQTHQRQNLKVEKIPQEFLFTNFQSKVISISSFDYSLFDKFGKYQVQSAVYHVVLGQIFQLLNFAVMIQSFSIQTVLCRIVLDIWDIKISWRPTVKSQTGGRVIFVLFDEQCLLYSIFIPTQDNT